MVASGSLPALELYCGGASDCQPASDCSNDNNDCSNSDCSGGSDNSGTPEIPPPTGDSGSTPAPPTDTDQPPAPGDAHDSSPPSSDAPPTYQDQPPMEGGRRRVELGNGEVPEALQKYASYENGSLVIDAHGDEIPALNITRDDVVIRNARIKGDAGAPSIAISGANNVTIEDSEISGGSRGVLADHSSNVTVKNSWLHDFSWSQPFDTTAVEFDYVNGGSIEGNQVTGLYKSDAVNMYESSNVRATGNRLDITIDEWSSAPLMVEGNTSSGIEVSNNTIDYPVGNNVPPGILGGRNQNAFNNTVNGDSSRSAWQFYAYNDVWENIYFDGQQIA